jgi:hypothetical protein
MTDAIQTTGELVERAGSSILEVGVVGALLLLSILGNVALVWAVIRAYRQTAAMRRRMRGEY